MAGDPVPAIEKTLNSADRTVRRRLAALGIGEPNHMIMAMSPNGAAVIRSNCGPEVPREMAGMPVEIAEQVEQTGEGKLN
jgi:hypothetical protein